MRYRAGVPTSSFTLFTSAFAYPPPLAVVATTPGSGFVEMILHLPIQNQPPLVTRHQLLAPSFPVSSLRFQLFLHPPSC
jgi:hypothetical protein